MSPPPPMPSLQLSGLASGLDWKSLVDQLIDLERAPINRIQREQTTNTQRSTAIKDLGVKLTALQSAAADLGDQALFSGRTASSATAASTWSLAASPGTETGAFAINVSQLATKARRIGASDITGGISGIDNVSGVTLATMSTAAVVTAGKFTVNGQQITIATTDSLQSVLDAITTATGGDVTATYSAATDKITLDSVSNAPITLGAGNDTSNFLQALKLSNNGTDNIVSSGKLGSARLNNTLVSAGLNAGITPVDGTFTINGTAIAYNINTDTLNSVLDRINAAGAGVTASYDAVNDRISLVNSVTGDLGLTLSESAGGLLGALGLTTGYTTVAGANAEFSVDGGPTLISTSNTLDGAAHGITGLEVTVDSVSAQTISVAADTEKMRTKIDAFVTAYNAIQTYIDDKSKVTSTNGKVTTAVLSSNRDVQDWSRQLRRMVFEAIPGLNNTIDRLDDLGLDLNREGQLSIKDSAKLDRALADHPTDVEMFFTTSTTGFAAKFETLLDSLNDSGETIQENYTSTNSSLDRQIADLERRLTQQRELLTSRFIAMETAQSRIQQQSSAIANAFSLNSSR